MMYVPGMPALGSQLFLNLILGLAVAAAEAVGGYLMYRMRLTGWWILALGLVLNLVNSLLHLSASGLVITLAVGYVHLLVKPRYS